MNLNEWAKRGEMISVLGREIFVIDEGDKENTLVILHGYGTSSLDYYKLLPELVKNYRVVIQDFIGFGFSEKPVKYYFNILEQADFTLELWRILKLKNITLLSHNYGSQVAIELLTRLKTNLTDIDIQKLILLNSTISFNHTKEPDDNFHPLEEFSNRLEVMLNSFSFYKKKIKEFFYLNDTISDDEIEDRWKLINHKNGREVIDFLYNYNTESKLLWKRWFTAVKSNSIPTTIISGKNDIIFNENEAMQFYKELNGSELHFINDCGHYPMLEQPQKLKTLILQV
jgi:pimeloyl-ACP methyl ester carboxylesterase